MEENPVERVPCRSCGAPILATTAARTGGLCKLCEGGYRQDMELARRRRQVELDYENSPAGKYWKELVKRVFQSPNCFDSLSAPEKTFYSVRCLIGAVNNGGFYHYFDIEADRFQFVVDGLRLMDDSKTLRFVLEARDLLFGYGEMPASASLPDLKFLEGDSERSDRLDSLQKEFWADRSSVFDRCHRFGIEHGLFSET